MEKCKTCYDNRISSTLSTRDFDISSVPQE